MLVLVQKNVARPALAGIIIPLLKVIKSRLLLKPITIEFPAVREKIVQGLEKRVGDWPKNLLLALPTILDPKFKSIKFSTSSDESTQKTENVLNLEHYFEEIASQLALLKPDQESISLQQVNRSKQDFFDEIFDDDAEVPSFDEQTKLRMVYLF